MFKKSSNTNKNPAVAASRAMVESLEGRAMFSVTGMSEIVVGTGPGGGPHVQRDVGGTFVITFQGQTTFVSGK